MRCTIALAALLAAAPAAQQPPDPPTPRPAPRSVGALRIDPGGIDLGSVEARSTHRGSVSLANTGRVALVIIDTKSSCVCTASDDIRGRTIAPGESIPFNVTFRAPTEPGERTSQVHLIFSEGDREPQAAVVPIVAQITMPLRGTPPYVDALNGVTGGEVTVASADGKPFRVLSAGGAPPEYADGYDAARDEARNSYRLAWTVPARSTADCRGARLWWPVETDHPQCPVLPMRIRHECTGGRSDPARKQRGWVFQEQIELLGALRGGAPVEVDVELNNTARVPIASVASLSPDATAVLLGTSELPGDLTRCRVRFTPRAGVHGLLYAMVEFRSRNGNKDVAFIGRVTPS